MCFYQCEFDGMSQPLLSVVSSAPHRLLQHRLAGLTASRHRTRLLNHTDNEGRMALLYESDTFLQDMFHLQIVISVKIFLRTDKRKKRKSICLPFLQLNLCKEQRPSV